MRRSGERDHHAQSTSESGGFLFSIIRKLNNRCTARHRQCLHSNQAAHMKDVINIFVPRIEEEKPIMNEKGRISRTHSQPEKNDFTVVFFPVFLFDFLTLRIEPYTTRVHVESMINDSKRASGLLFFFGKEKERRLEHRFPVYRKDIHSRKREKKRLVSGCSMLQSFLLPKKRRQRSSCVYIHSYLFPSSLRTSIR